MTIRPAAFLAAAGLLALAAGHVPAQPTPPSHGLNALDKDYLKATAQSNLEEIALPPLVDSHASGTAFRRFALRMKRDHTRANAQLTQLAARVGDSLPQDVSEDQHHIMDRLGQFRGALFDAVYRQEMIHDHTEDIATTEREISLGSDPRVVSSARQNLAMLRMHLRLSQGLPSGRTPRRAGRQ